MEHRSYMMREEEEERLVYQHCDFFDGLFL